MTSIPTSSHKELKLVLEVYYNLVFLQFLKQSTEPEICHYIGIMDMYCVIPNVLTLSWKLIQTRKGKC